MEIVLFVEGHTEKALPEFLKRWLDPRVPQPIGIKTVRFDGWPNFYDEIAKKVELNLTGKTGAGVVGAVGVLDLYGPTIYPPDRTTVHERYAWFKKDIESKVRNPRYRQHFAVHETEAWLLSSPSILPAEVRGALPGKCAQPETVNFDMPPAKLLDRLYREKLKRGYKKVIDGTNLFRTLDPGVAYDKCPHLKLLLDDMLAMARSD
ncbi:DUF4276 family protein [Sorangium sp. So ce381]|uniref:DUF4276 family protein n=1 Tax=Sorangium sp. So ce381 TaxID=3133307 RepID=UPI003F5AEC83